MILFFMVMFLIFINGNSYLHAIWFSTENSHSWWRKILIYKVRNILNYHPFTKNCNSCCLLDFIYMKNKLLQHKWSPTKLFLSLTILFGKWLIYQYIHLFWHSSVSHSNHKCLHSLQNPNKTYKRQQMYLWEFNLNNNRGCFWWFLQQVLVFKDIELRYGETRSRGFFTTVRAE